MNTTFTPQTTVGELHRLMDAQGTNVAAAMLLGAENTPQGTIFFIRDEALAQAVLKTLSMFASDTASDVLSHRTQ